MLFGICCKRCFLLHFFPLLFPCGLELLTPTGPTRQRRQRIKGWIGMRPRYYYIQSENCSRVWNFSVDPLGQEIAGLQCRINLAAVHGLVLGEVLS